MYTHVYMFICIVIYLNYISNCSLEIFWFPLTIDEYFTSPTRLVLSISQ